MIRELKENYGEPGCLVEHSICMSDFKRLLEEEQSLQIVDVRETDEFESFHLPATQNIPLSGLAKGSHELDDKKSVYLICATGKRSLAAYEWMKEHRPQLTVYHVDGGIQNYKTLCS